MNSLDRVDWVLVNRLWLAACCLLALVTGCALLQPKAGDACKPDEAVCYQKTGALLCRGGSFVLTSCKGPQACSTAKDQTVSCDQTAGAAAEEACLPMYEGQSQCLAGESPSFLTCRSGRWERGACAGGACRVSSGLVVCE